MSYALAQCVASVIKGSHNTSLNSALFITYLLCTLSINPQASIKAKKKLCLYFKHVVLAVLEKSLALIA